MLQSSETRDNVERGAEGGIARENMELRKLGDNTGPIWCDGAEVDVKTGLVLK